MFERQFGLRENPFAAGHQSKYVYPSHEHQEALAHLRFGIENREPFVMITGEVGTGKTTALYDALSEWKSRAVVALITNSALTRSELYEEICLRFGVPLAPPISKPMLMGHLERHLLSVRSHGDFAILLIDEAQNLDRELLEEVRLLSNLESQGENLLQIFLVGQPELEEKLGQTELRQLRQRIAVQYRLRPLSPEDTERYIHHRISVAGGHAISLFPADACLEVYQITHGIPREINTVAAQALLNAFVEDSPNVRPEHVRAAQRDTEFRSVLDREQAAAAAAAVTAEAAAHAAGAAPVAPLPPPESPSSESVVVRDVRHVPESAPGSPAAEGRGAASESGSPGGPGVRPAGNAETWQSWMASLAKLPPPPAPAPAPEVKAEAEVEADTEAEAEAEADERAAFEEFRWQGAAPAVPEPDNAFVVPLGDERAAPPAPPSLEPAREVAAEPVEPMPLVEEFAAVPIDAEPPQAPEYEEVAESPLSEALPAPTPPIDEPISAFERMTAAHASVKPATPPTPPPPIALPPPPRPLDNLPPRLRERLEAAERAERTPGSRATGWLIALAVVAAVVIGIILTARFRESTSSKTPPAPTPASTGGATSTSPVPATPTPAPATTTPASTTPASSAPTTAAAPTTAPAPTTGSAPAVTSAPSPTTAATEAPTPPGTPVSIPMASGRPGEKTPAGPTGPTPTAGSASAPEAAFAKPGAPPKPAVARMLYGVAVGTYLVEDRATAEKARLAAAARLPGRVIASKEGDFSVVLGAFAERANAERMAGDLITRGLVDEARVVPFPNPAYKP